MCGGSPELCLEVSRVPPPGAFAPGVLPQPPVTSSRPCHLLVVPQTRQAQVLPLGLCTDCSVARNALPRSTAQSPGHGALFTSLCSDLCDCQVSTVAPPQTCCTQGWAPFSPHRISQIGNRGPQRGGHCQRYPGMAEPQLEPRSDSSPLHTLLSCTQPNSPSQVPMAVSEAARGLGCLLGPD